MKLIKKYFPYNILFVLFLIILYFSPICGDDWGNYLVGKMGLFTDIKNAVGMYFVWEGRFISRILINILTYHKLLWNIVNSLVIISIIYLMVKIINPKDKRRVIILSILTILFMNILMFSQVVTWVAGNITYLFVIPFFLSYIYIIINGKDKGNIVYVTIFLNIIMTMFIEHMGVLLVFFNLFINVIYYLKNKKINKKYIMYFIISLLSFSLMFFSPGNKERNMVENTYFNKLNIFEKIKYNFNNFINYTFVYNPYLLILMSISNYYLMKENIRNKGIRICASIFFIIPLIYTIITYFVAVFQNTSYTSNIYLNIYFIIYIVMEFVLIYRYSKKEEKNTKLLFYILGFMANVVMLMSPTWGYRTSFTTYLFLSIVYINIIDDLKNSNKKINNILVGVTTCSFLIYLIMYFNVFLCEKDLRESIKKQVKNNKDVIDIYYFPYFTNCDINPNDEYHIKKYKEYYDIPEEKSLNYITNKFKYYIIYKK